MRFAKIWQRGCSASPRSKRPLCIYVVMCGWVDISWFPSLEVCVFEFVCECLCLCVDEMYVCLCVFKGMCVCE